MTIRPTLMACATVATFLVSPASALTAPELWDDWRNSLGLLGQEVEIANQSYDSGVLRLEGITQRMPIDPEVGRNITFIDALVLTEQSDGSVRIEIDGEYRVDFGGVSGGDRSDGSLSISFDGLDSNARGAPGDLSYDFGAGLVEVALDTLSVNGEPVPVEFSLAATGLSSTSTQTDSVYAGGGQVDALALVVNASDPNTGVLEMNYRLTQLEFQGSANYADFAALGANDPSAIFRAETPTALTTTHGPMSFHIVTDSPQGAGAVSGQATSGSLESEFGRGRALYGAGVAGLILEIVSSDAPFPIDLQADQLGFRVDAPMLAAADPQPFAAALAISGLALPDALWSMVDPTGLLARDPAELSLQLAGLARLDRDLSDPDFAAAGTPPGALLALKLDRLSLAIAGAAAQASGDFNINPDAPPMLDGVPAASGQLELELRGVGGLLQNLASLGAIDPANLMGAQMMLGMITAPAADGSDVMTSTIQLGEDGSVTANGTRLR
ncbi:MAG: hypothetical protein AAGA38_14805 [Pseudomonadota bacterium]